MEKLNHLRLTCLFKEEVEVELETTTPCVLFCLIQLTEVGMKSQLEVCVWRDKQSILEVV